MIWREVLRFWAAMRTSLKFLQQILGWCYWAARQRRLPCPVWQLLPLYICWAACEASSLSWLQGSCSLQGTCH